MRSLSTSTNFVDIRADGVKRKRERKGASRHEMPALGNHGNKKAPRGYSNDDFSNELWRLQRTLWAITDFPRLAGCHRWLANNAGGAQLQWSPGNARWGGLQTSDSVWASPLSALKISRVRSAEVTNAVDAWKSESPAHTVEFLTLTVRHDASQSLSDVWAAVAQGWKGITQTASWRGGSRYEGDKSIFGIEHYCRSVEVTIGENGWHVHLHILLFLNDHLNVDSRESLKTRLFSRWKSAIVRAGFKAPSTKNGVKIEEAVKNQDAASMGAYMAKGSIRSIGDEIARGQQKLGRTKTSRTPFQVLSDIATSREKKEHYLSDLRLWQEWEKSSLGRRQMTWSRNAKKELGILDMDDVQLIALENEKAQEDSFSVAVIPAESWSKTALGCKTRFSDDVDMRLLITREVAKEKTPVQAQEKAKEILSLLEIEHTNELVQLGTEKLTSTSVNTFESRSFLNPVLAVPLPGNSCLMLPSLILVLKHFSRMHRLLSYCAKQQEFEL